MACAKEYFTHNLVIWRIFIWSFGKFSFGHLAGFHLVIWLLPPSAFGSFILTKRFSFSFWFSFNFLISSPLTSDLLPLTSEKMCPVFQHNHIFHLTSSIRHHTSTIIHQPSYISHLIMPLFFGNPIHILSKGTIQRLSVNQSSCPL